MGVMQQKRRNTKGCYQTTRSSRTAMEQILPHGPQKEPTVPTPDLVLPAPRTVTQYISVFEPFSVLCYSNSSKLIHTCTKFPKEIFFAGNDHLPGGHLYSQGILTHRTHKNLRVSAYFLSENPKLTGKPSRIWRSALGLPVCDNSSFAKDSRTVTSFFFFPLMLRTNQKCFIIFLFQTHLQGWLMSRKSSTCSENATPFRSMVAERNIPDPQEPRSYSPWPTDLYVHWNRSLGSVQF